MKPAQTEKKPKEILNLTMEEKRQQIHALREFIKTRGMESYVFMMAHKELIIDRRIEKSKEERLTLASAFRKNLPLELRGLVYDQFLESSKPKTYNVDTIVDQIVHDNTKVISKDMTAVALDQNSVGAPVAAEVAAHWYGTHLFVVKPHVHRSTLSQFLRTNIWGTHHGFRSHAVVRHLRVELYAFRSKVPGRENDEIRLQPLLIVNKDATIDLVLMDVPKDRSSMKFLECLYQVYATLCDTLPNVNCILKMSQTGGQLLSGSSAVRELYITKDMKKLHEAKKNDEANPTLTMLQGIGNDVQVTATEFGFEKQCKNLDLFKQI